MIQRKQRLRAAVAMLVLLMLAAQDPSRLEGQTMNTEKPSKTEIAVLGGGCFWCLEPIFSDLKGVENVEVGYTGGHTPDPTYKAVSSGGTGHAEVARITNGQVPINVVSRGDIRSDHLAGINSTGQRFASMPLYTAGGRGMGRRQCTREYKIEPIEREIRRLLGVGKGKRVPKDVAVEQWIGISTDELERLKQNPHRWAHNRWPLIEARMSRADCRVWFEREYPGVCLVKSACTSCPFRDNAMWRNLRDSHPLDFEDACQFDEAIRHNGSTLRGMREQQFVHRSGVPLRAADLEDNAIGDLFRGECDGMCGV